MFTNHSRRRAALGLVGAAVLAMGMAACGSSNKSGSSSGAPTASVDQSLAAKVPASIKSAGKINIGTDSTYAPSEFLDTDGKTVIGFDVDLFNAVAQKLGLKTSWESAKFGDIIPGVQSGKYDAGVSSVTINTDREAQALMISYFNAGTQWATQKGNPNNANPDDMCGKPVAVQKDTVQETEDLPVRNKKCTDAGKPALKVDAYPAQDAATNAVISGKDQAMLADSPVIAYAVKQSNGKLEALGDIYDSAPYGVVVKKDQQQLAEAIRDAYAALIADGTYQKILEKWGVQAGALKGNPAINPPPA
jgi:polar amino acid transport system substrate-binding protein